MHYLWIACMFDFFCACMRASVFNSCRDLKRDIAKKLEKLERRTQKAIVEIIRLSFRAIMLTQIGEQHAGEIQE